MLALLNLILPLVLPEITKATQSYLNKEISQQERDARIAQAWASAFSQIETQHADTLAKTFESFMGAAKTSLLLRVVWATVVLSQLAVLLWHQLGIPLFTLVTGHPYPSSGATTDWAYLLVAAGIGLGPVVLRSGPGRGNMLETVKSFLGRK